MSICCSKTPDRISTFHPARCGVFPFAFKHFRSTSPSHPLCDRAQCHVQLTSDLRWIMKLGEGAGGLAGLGMLTVAVHSGTVSVNGIRFICKQARYDEHMIFCRRPDIIVPQAG